MTIYSDTLRDEDSRPIGGALVYVYNEAGTVLEALTDPVDGVTPIDNPVTSDEFGNFTFDAIDGKKILDIRLGGNRVWKEHLLIGLPPPGPTGSIEISGIKWTTPQQFQVAAGLPLELGGDVQDDSAAFVAAIAYLKTLKNSTPYGEGCPSLFIPAGKYYLGTTTLDLTCGIRIFGESLGEAGGAATQLRWAAGATGIRVQRYNTVGDSSTYAGVGGVNGGDASIIEKLKLKGGYTASSADYHGIHLRARATIRDCYIENFQGDGIFIKADTGQSYSGNANNFEVSRCFVTACRNGIYVEGADANAGGVTALDVIGCRAWGVNDNSGLGNTYVACHVSSCVSGAYRSTGLSACCVFIGCYSESGQPASSFSQRSLVLGGLHGAGVGTAAWLRADAGALLADQDMNIDGDFVVGGTTTFGGSASAWSGAVFTAFAGAGTGNFVQMGGNLNFAGSFKPGIIANNGGTGTQPFWVQSSEIQWIFGGDGFSHLTLSGTGMVLTGNMAVDGVYKVDGTQVLGNQGAAVADASGGATVDTEARAAINALLARVRAHGIIAT